MKRLAKITCALALGLVVVSWGCARFNRMRSVQTDDQALVEHHDSLVEIEPWLGAIAVAESTDYEVTFDQACSTGDSGQFTGQPTMSILWMVTPRTGAGERGVALIDASLRKAEWRKTEEPGSESPRGQY